MKRWYWLTVAALVLFAIVYASRSDYRAFDAQREDWHRRCDAYIGSHASASDRPQVVACQRELTELTAYATRKGWGE